MEKIDKVSGLQYTEMNGHKWEGTDPHDSANCLYCGISYGSGSIFEKCPKEHRKDRDSYDRGYRDGVLFVSNIVRRMAYGFLEGIENTFPKV